MAYAHKINRVTIFGTSFNGAEEWSTGFFLGNSSADPLPPTQAGADFIRDEWDDFWNTANNQIGYLWKTVGVKIATLETDGKVNADSVKTSYYPTPIAGPYTGNGNPPQIALVASLLSAPGTGLGRKGRMFIPGVGAGISSDGKIVAPYPQSVADTLAQFFSDINGSADVGDRVVNASKGRKPPAVGAGITWPVESVKVGNVFDTQRRRRNQLSESYVAATVNG